MISLFRQFIKSWAFAGLMGLLILSFAVFGMNDVFKSVGNGSVITADGRSVSVFEFKTFFDQYKDAYTQKTGTAISYDDLVEAGQHTAVLEQIADKTAMGAWLNKINITPSPKIFFDAISKIQAFFNPVTGQFDKTLYLEALAKQKITEKMFEQDVTDQIARAHFVSAAVAGIKMPRIYSALDAADRQQSRDMSFFLLNPGNVAKPSEPTEAELKAFYQTNKERFEEPEIRQVRIIRFVPEDFASKVTVDEAALKKMYEFRAESLSTPETRSFIEITAPDAKAAAAIASGLRAGQDPNAVAKANKGNVLAFDRKPKTAVPDSKIADVAFTMKSGEISAPISGSLGYAVIQMGQMYPGSTQSFEQARPQLETEYKQAQAKAKMAEASEAYQDAHDKGESFDAIAARLGLKVFDIPPMMADGRTMDQNLNMQQFPDILKVAFSLPQNGESDVESMGKGQYFVLKVIKIKPAGMIPFEQVKGQLSQSLMMQKWSEAIAAKADEATNQLNSGADINKVALSMNSKVETLSGVDRISGPKTLGENIVGKLFITKSGQSFQASSDNVQIVVGRTTKINNGSADTANAITAYLGQSQVQRFTSDLGSAVSGQIRTTVHLKTFPDAAASALGVKVEPKKKDEKKVTAKP